MNSIIDINIELTEIDLKTIIADHVNEKMNLPTKIYPGDIKFGCNHSLWSGDYEVTADIKYMSRGELGL